MRMRRAVVATAIRTDNQKRHQEDSSRTHKNVDNSNCQSPSSSPQSFKDYIMKSPRLEQKKSSIKQEMEQIEAIIEEEENTIQPTHFKWSLSGKLQNNNVVQDEPNGTESFREDSPSEVNAQGEEPETELNMLTKSALYECHGKKKYYDGKALFCFSIENPIRRGCLWLTEWKAFEYFILSMILINSIILALYDYEDRDSETTMNYVLDMIGMVLTIIFTLECVLKIIALGFVIHKYSYLRDGFNFIDFLVVVAGIIEFLPIDSINLKSLRVLRVLRPLRSINIIPTLKEQVETLIKALPDFANVGGFLLFVFLIFSILGLHQYNGIFYNRCRIQEEPELTYWPLNETETRVCTQTGSGKFSCYGDEICGNPVDVQMDRASDGVINNGQIYYGIVNFDHLGTALLTVFQIITTDSWSQVMYNLFDADTGIIAGIFFILLIVVGSFFMLNLILAVIIQGFIQSQKDRLFEEVKEIEEAQEAGEQKKKATKGNQIYAEKQESDERAFTLDNKEQQAADDFHGPPPLEKNQSQLSHQSSGAPDLSFLNPVIQKKKFVLALQEVSAPKVKNEELDVSLDLVDKALKEQEEEAKRMENDVLSDPLKDSNEAGSSDIEQLNYKSNQQLLDDQAEGKTFPPKSHTLIPQQTNSQKLTEGNVEPPKQKSLQMMLSKGKTTQLDLIRAALFQKLDAASYNNSITSITNFRQINEMKKDLMKFKRSGKQLQSQSTIQLYKLEERAENNCFYYICYKIQASDIFGIFINCVIVANTFVLALDKYPIEEALTAKLDIFNLVFTGIFFVEMIIKMVGLTWRGYFEHAFNIFDCVIVVLSVIDLVLDYTLDASTVSALTALRGFRLLRVFKLAKSWSKFHMVLKTVSSSLKEVSSFSILLFLFIYIYTLLGLELFAYYAKFNEAGEFDLENGAEPMFSFDGFFDSIITVFIILTNDGWSGIYFNYYRAVGATASTIYFVTLIIIGQMILLNLFLAILLNNFDSVSMEKEQNTKKEETEVDDEQLLQSAWLFKRWYLKAKKFFKEKHLEWENRILADKKLRSDRKKNIERIMRKEGSSGTHSFRTGTTAAATNVYTTANTGESQLDLEYNEFMDQLDGRALFILGPTNKFRIFLYRLVTSRIFEGFIIFVIFLSCVHLAIETPLLDPEGGLANFLYYTDIITTIIFTVECVLQILTFGFLVNGKNSYLRSAWNLMDFIIVLFSLAGLKSNELKIFKMFRVLRPLRVVSKNEGLKTAVLALFQSIPHILSIILIVLLFMLIFGILGINFFKGLFFYCDDSVGYDYSLVTKWDCLNNGREWINKEFHFDNIFEAMKSLVEIASGSYWSIVMNDAMAITSLDRNPVEGSKLYYAIYFVVYMITGSFFLLNLFVGVVIVRFQHQKNSITGNALLTADQQEWVDIKIQYLKAKPIKKPVPPENRFRARLYLIQDNNWFQNGIFVCVILNTLILPIKWYGQSDTVSTVTEAINYVFTGIFTLEAIIKIIALDVRYFKDGWNVFDFVIVFGSLLSILLTFVSSINLGGATSILRAFRVSRIFRLVNRAKRLKIVFNTFIVSLPAMANVGGLLFLLLYLYSVLGVYLFSEVTLNGFFTANQNFSNFTSAFLTMFVVATGDGWGYIMNAAMVTNDLMTVCIESPTYQDYVNNGYETIGCGNAWGAYLFFYSYYLLVALIFLNLFIAIILDGYQETRNKESRAFNQDCLNQFREVWSEFDPEATGFMKSLQMRDFLKALGRPMGFPPDIGNSKFRQHQFIAKLDLPLYNDFQDYLFMDVLEKLSYRVTVQQFVREKLMEEEKKNLDDSLVHPQEHPDWESKEKALEREIQQNMNKISYNEQISGIQALREVKQREQKSETGKDALNRDSFSSQHQEAARVVFGKFRHETKKKKLERSQQESQIKLNQMDMIKEEAKEEAKDDSHKHQHSMVVHEEIGEEEANQIVEEYKTAHLESKPDDSPQGLLPQSEGIREKIQQMNQAVDKWNSSNEQQIPTILLDKLKNPNDSLNLDTILNEEVQNEIPPRSHRTASKQSTLREDFLGSPNRSKNNTVTKDNAEDEGKGEKEKSQMNLEIQVEKINYKLQIGSQTTNIKYQKQEFELNYDKH